MTETDEIQDILLNSYEMADPIKARLVIGIIGKIISFGLFISPTPTMYKIIKSKSVQKFHVDPYVATVLNCVMWIIYGVPQVNRDRTINATTNSFGLIVEIIYVIIFFYYSVSGSLTRRKIIGGLIFEAIFTAVVIVITFAIVHTTEIRAEIVGTLCVSFNILMYLSPLTVMKQVITTKSVEYMPFWLSLTSFVNGACWTAYACITFDPWMVIPNGLGVFSGIIQLVLYSIYYKTTDWSDNSAY